MTLAEHINAGAAYERRLVTVDPVDDMLAAGFARDDLQTAHDDLVHVQGRCVISNHQRQFLARVLARMA